MIDTKKEILSLFNQNEVINYLNMSQLLKEKYRLYITRRITVNTFYSDKTLSPSQWLEQYEEKKMFLYISKRLDMSLDEVIETYDSAINKIRKILKNRGIDNSDFLD